MPTLIVISGTSVSVVYAVLWQWSLWLRGGYLRNNSLCVFAAVVLVASRQWSLRLRGGYFCGSGLRSFALVVFVVSQHWSLQFLCPTYLWYPKFTLPPPCGSFDLADAMCFLWALYFFLAGTMFFGCGALRLCRFYDLGSFLTLVLGFLCRVHF